MGIRTPDLLHAISRQPIHLRLPAQVTVLEHALQSAWVRAGCGTSVLYSPGSPQECRT
jgi:predicted HD phosphohydrolase